jgi:hypothetical protein
MCEVGLIREWMQVLDMRSTVVKEGCETLAQFVSTVGTAKCKILVRDLFPSLLEARGGSSKASWCRNVCCGWPHD